MSIPLLLAVFFLGFVLGALLVSLERRVRIEQIRREFRAKLEELTSEVAGEITAKQPQREVAAKTQERGKSSDVA